MFIRFAATSIHEESRVAGGIFCAAYEVRDVWPLEEYEHWQLREVLDWFDENLRRPTRLSISRRGHARMHGVCWLRHTAKDHLRKMWELADLLQRCDRVIRAIKSERPGFVIYEDAFQVIAVPVRDNRRLLI